MGSLTLKSLREDGAPSTKEAIANNSVATSAVLQSLQELFDKTDLNHEERSKMVFKFLNESSLMFKGVIDYVGNPEVEMTPSDVDRFRVEVLSRQIERGQVEPSVGVEKLLKFNLSLKEATSRWLEVDSRAPIEWFESQNSMPELRKDEFLFAVVDFALSKGEASVASEWINKIQDVNLRKELKQKIDGR